jgi:hypothetical protein
VGYQFVPSDLWPPPYSRIVRLSREARIGLGLSLVGLAIGYVVQAGQSLGLNLTTLERWIVLGGSVLILLFGMGLLAHALFWAKDRNAAVADHLGLLLVQGMAERQKCGDETLAAPLQEAKQWVDEVNDYLEKQLGARYLARFSSSAGLPMSATSIASMEHRRLWGQLHYREARLTEFIQELSK